MQNEKAAISFKDWVAQAISEESSATAGPHWGLSRLPEEKRESLINDISDVYEDLRNSSNLLDELQRDMPDTDKLEKAFVEVEIRVAHAVHHWRRVLDCLQAEKLWMEDSFFDRHSM
jgi:hypothetical protein